MAFKDNVDSKFKVQRHQDCTPPPKAVMYNALERIMVAEDSQTVMVNTSAF